MIEMTSMYYLPDRLARYIEWTLKGFLRRDGVESRFLKEAEEYLEQLKCAADYCIEVKGNKVMVGVELAPARNYSGGDCVLMDFELQCG